MYHVIQSRLASCFLIGVFRGSVFDDNSRISTYSIFMEPKIPLIVGHSILLLLKEEKCC